MCISEFELSVSQSRNAIYFSTIAMPKKSHFNIFAIQNFAQNTKKMSEFHLYCWDHVCKVNEWCLVDCFHHELRVSTQIMVRNYCITKCKKFSSCGGFLMVLGAIFSRSKIFTLIRTLYLCVYVCMSLCMYMYACTCMYM